MNVTLSNIFYNPKHGNLLKLSLVAFSIFALFSIFTTSEILNANASSHATIIFQNVMPSDGSLLLADSYFLSHGMYVVVTLSGGSLPSQINVEFRSLDASGNIVDTLPLVFVKVSTNSYVLPTTYVYFTDVPNHPQKLTKPYLYALNNFQIEVEAEGVISTQIIKTVNNSLGSLPTTIGPQPVYQTPNCSTLGGKDNDGLCNDWQDPLTGLHLRQSSTSPIVYSWSCTTTNVLNVCPQPGVDDIYVEVDWLKGHEPDQQALIDVVQSFQNKGINLHIQKDEEIPFHNLIITPMSPSGPDINPLTGLANQDFDRLKQKFFGTLQDRTGNPTEVADRLTAKRMAFHYAIFAHNIPGDNSGKAETPGNDFLISLGLWPGGVGSSDDQAGTFMHELGHNLGLYHGGNFPPDHDGDGDVDQADFDADNCKPNYLSVMSYSRQFSTPLFQRPIDFSNETLDTTLFARNLNQLMETDLDEKRGITTMQQSSSVPFIFGENSGLNSFVGYTGYWLGPPVLLWYTFEENDAPDNSGNLNNGIVSNLGTAIFPLVVDRIGKALQFDSLRDVEVADSSDFNFDIDDPFSISFWIKTSSPGHEFIVSKKGGLSTSQKGWVVLSTSYNEKALFGISNGNNWHTLSGGNIDNGLWHHVVATYSGIDTNNQATMKLYVDGGFVNIKTISITGTIQNTEPVMIGDNLSDNYQFNGELDDVMIFNSELSTDQVARIHSEKNLLWLDFEQSTEDSSMQENHGNTPSGASYSTIGLTKPGKAYVFALSSNNDVQISNPGPFNFDIDDPFSISFWIKTSSPGHEFIVSKKAGLSTSQKGWVVLSTSYNEKALFGISNGNNWHTLSGGNIDNGLWHHVVATYSGINTNNQATMKLYVDGGAPLSNTFTIAGTIQNTEPVMIGDNLSGNYQFNGELDDVMIWNYELEQIEVNALNDLHYPNGYQVTIPVTWENSDLLGDASENVNELPSFGCTGGMNVLAGYDDWDNLKIDMFNPNWITPSVQDGL